MFGVDFGAADEASGGFFEEMGLLPDKTWANFQTEFAELFPGWDALFDSSPELESIIFSWWERVGQDLDPSMGYTEMYNMLLQAIKKSDWWRTQPETYRDALLLEADDPATYKENLRVNREFAVEAAYRLFGGGFPESFYDKIARRAELYNWSDQKIEREIVRSARLQEFGVGKPTKGNVKRTHDTIMDYSQQMMVPLGGTAWDFAYKVNAGVLDIEAAKDHINSMAIAKFGNYLDIRGLTEQGKTVVSVFDEQRQAIADTLELDFEDVHMWKLSMNELFPPHATTTLPTTVVGDSEVQLHSGGRGSPDDDKGRRAMMSYTDAVDWAKSKPRYKTTRNFRDQLTQLSGAISQVWGAR